MFWHAMVLAVRVFGFDGSSGHRVSCDFGDGKCTIERALQNQFGELRKWDRSGLCPRPLRKMIGREQTGGGGKRIM